MDWSLFDARPVIVAIAGPNGAGKTTFHESHLRATALLFINADVLERSVRVHSVVLDELGNQNDRISQDEIGGSFTTYNTYLLVLEPVGGPTLTSMQIQASENYLDKFSAFFITDGG